MCGLPGVQSDAAPAGRGGPGAALRLWLTASSLRPDAGTQARLAHCPGWLGRGSAGRRGWGARMVGSGTVATSFLPSGGVRLRSRGPGGLLPALAARLSRAASSSRLASLTSLRSESQISGKYRPARTIRCAGTGEEQRRGCVSGSDGRYRQDPGLPLGKSNLNSDTPPSG
ncbi:uncharacterized protein LOC113918553 [Zalophus californianus]|uniref:Uncharacterized protein LOC113918553 n=1 Tax=Zalophus californianus TaxID=9704 RepID=A0A6J2CGE1_ZALCA|nr:uncharacterized protein LOC113918553 [Zalophus californianus]